MTQDKSRKAAIRARMAATGEPYTLAARRLAEQHDPVTGIWGGPLARVRVAVSDLFFDGDGRVLLARRTATELWDLPGRYLRPHETPSGASVEMLPELLGITPVIGRMLVVDWALDPDDGFPEADKATFVFDGGRLDAEQVARIAPDPGEIAEYAFHDPGLLAGLLISRLNWRVTAAIAARDGAPDRYLELGLGGR
jgi:8-oxo-dGTP diphosphatase